jgi:hypothetical protein
MRVPALGLAGLVALSVQAAEPAKVGHPEDYRDWRHVKSMELKPGHALYESFGGIHHVYANPKAIKGYGTGHFPDGAILVFDLLEAKSEGDAMIEGKRKLVGVMVRDSSRFAATGGWGFEGFAGGDPQKPLVQGNARRACFECHAAQKGN